MPLTEFEIIDKYFSNLTGADEQVALGIGDDAAVINIRPGKQLVASVDTLVGGIHFFTDADAFDIGYKSLAVNISDMAAMGAEPRWTTLSLTMPENNPGWIGRFADGFSVLAGKYGISLVGGDMTYGPLSISVQILGMVDENKAVTRSGAGTGDLIYVSGCLGGAGLALSHFKKTLASNIIPSQASIDRLLRPCPRVDLGYKLTGLASSAIDISDGLAADLGHILKASDRGARVNLASVPVCADLFQIRDHNERLRLALCAGDDYELCFTVPENSRDEVERIGTGLDVPLQHIGSITEGNSIRWLQADGTEYRLAESGYRHF